jgi:hypothetical protein
LLVSPVASNSYPVTGSSMIRIGLLLQRCSGTSSDAGGAAVAGDPAPLGHSLEPRRRGDAVIADGTAGITAADADTAWVRRARRDGPEMPVWKPRGRDLIRRGAEPVRDTPLARRGP